MGLFTFFRINMPYGIKKTTTGEWFAFNREYMPLGWNTKDGQQTIWGDKPYAQYPIHTAYEGITEALLLQVAGGEKSVRRSEQGEIHTVFFYEDRTNPSNNPDCWGVYVEKLKLLSRLKIKGYGS